MNYDGNESMDDLVWLFVIEKLRQAWICEQSNFKLRSVVDLSIPSTLSAPRDVKNHITGFMDAAFCL